MFQDQNFKKMFLAVFFGVMAAQASLWLATNIIRVEKDDKTVQLLEKIHAELQTSKVSQN